MTAPLPHNRTYLVAGRDLVTLCAECAATKAPLWYQGIGDTIRACSECGRTASQIEQAKP